MNVSRRGFLGLAAAVTAGLVTIPSWTTEAPVAAESDAKKPLDIGAFARLMNQIRKELLSRVDYRHLITNRGFALSQAPGDNKDCGPVLILSGYLATNYLAVLQRMGPGGFTIEDCTFKGRPILVDPGMKDMEWRWVGHDEARQDNGGTVHYDGEGAD